MSNLHGIPDTLAEAMAREGDLLPNVILSAPGLVVPPSSMTIGPFPATAYVVRGTHLVYVTQAAASITLTGADGTYWLAIHADTHTAVASWTRVPGTHYLWRPSPTQPPGVDGLLGMAQVTVAGGVITAVAPNPLSWTLPVAWRTLLQLGTMALQQASAVAITGGTAALSLLTSTQVGVGTAPSYPFDVAGQAKFGAPVAIGANPVSNQLLTLHYPKNSVFALVIRPTDNDAGGGAPVIFSNLAGATVGSIQTTASSTAFNTSSDVRLKEAIVPLDDALDVLRAVKPVTFQWKADGTRGVGMLAHELQQVVPEAVSGSPDAPEPQGVDYSKLVPHLIASVQALLARLEALEVRLA